jgi:hypothetical protein
MPSKKSSVETKKKPTRPTTLAGKAVCALNATRHGLRSDRSVVMAAGETDQAWESFRADVVTSLGPAQVTGRSLRTALQVFSGAFNV